MDERVRRIERVVQDVDPSLEVKRMIRNMRVLAGSRAVAEVAPTGFRLLPDGDWVEMPMTPAEGLSALRRYLTVTRRDWAVAQPKPKVPPQPRPGSAEPSTPAAWADALQRRGVPASVNNDAVVVRGFGPVALPAPGKPLPRAAKRFIRDRTEEIADQLLRRAQAATRGEAVTVTTRKGRIVVLAGGMTLAFIDRYKMNLTGGGSVVADLLQPDASWDPLRRHVLRSMRPNAQVAPAKSSPSGSTGRKVAVALPPRPNRRPAPAPRSVEPSPNLHFELPGTLNPVASERAMAASARLRQERRIAPAAQLEISTPHGTLSFSPLDEDQNPLEATFTFQRGTEHVDGGLRLKRPDDPLALRTVGSLPSTLIGEAWAAALIVYAELTCSDLAAPAPPLPERAPTQRSRRGSGRAHQRTASIRTPQRGASSTAGPALSIHEARSRP